MGQVVRIDEPREEQVAQLFATVREVEGARVVYESSRRTGEATIAPSCLLEPQVGDRVLVAEQAAEAYVLCVLARASEDPLRMRMEGDVELSVSGSLRIAAKEGIDFASNKALRFVSSVLKMRASEGEVAVDRFVMLGREAVVNTRVAKLVASTFDSIVDRLQSHVKKSYRTVEEMEQLRAKRVDYRTEEELSLRGKHAFVHAADLVKVTGAQIHMG